MVYPSGLWGEKRGCYSSAESIDGAASFLRALPPDATIPRPGRESTAVAVPALQSECR